MHTTTSSASQLPRTARPPRPVWLVSVIAALAAAAATEVYGLGARAAGVPMAVAGLGATTATPITVGMFAMGTLVCAFWGTLLAVALARFASQPARAYLWATLVLTALSLAVPLTAHDTAVSTKLVLAGGHILAAAVIIPPVTRRLRVASGR